MPTQAKKLEQMQRVAEDSFLDENFGQLDLSGTPLGTKLASADDSIDPFLPDAKFAPVDERGRGLSSAALKNFLRSPDNDVIHEIARETRNPGLLEEIEQERRDLQAKEFVRNHPEYYPTDENFQALCDFLEEEKLAFTSQNLAYAFKALTEAGEIEFAPQAVRPLSQEELLEVTRYAQSESNQFVQTGVSESLRLAIERYIFFATQEKGLSPDRIMFDPTYRSLMDKAIFFCWCQARTDFTPTPERKRFFQEYAAGRPLSVPLLNQAWIACKKAESDCTRSSLLTQIEPTQQGEPDFNDLSDEAIDALFHDVTREALRSKIRR